MNKILLALAILGAGTAGALTARHSTIRLQRAANATRESWVVTTQALAAAQSERTGLAERIRELKQSLRQAEAAGNQNGLWSAEARAPNEHRQILDARTPTGIAVQRVEFTLQRAVGRESSA